MGIDLTGDNDGSDSMISMSPVLTMDSTTSTASFTTRSSASQAVDQA